MGFDRSRIGTRVWGLGFGGLGVLVLFQLKLSTPEPKLNAYFGV